MELKPGKNGIVEMAFGLLIELYGIETQVVDPHGRWVFLLIELYGIETRPPGLPPPALLALLIELYGIETNLFYIHRSLFYAF